MGPYLKNKTIATLSAFLLILSGCAIAKPVMTPSGNMGYSIECNGTAVPMTACYEKAAEVCPKGYNIVTQNNTSGVMANQFYVGGTSQKGLFIECKNNINSASAKETQ